MRPTNGITTTPARLRRPRRPSGSLLLAPIASGEEPLPLPLGLVTVGRSRLCDLVIRASRVFARHATLLVEPLSVTVEAAHDSAELRVNDTPVRRATLIPGDELAIGSASFRLESQQRMPTSPVETADDPTAPEWIGALEELHEWSRSGPLDRRGAMLGLLVERLRLSGAALVSLGPAGGVQVLNAWGEIVDVLRSGWVRERLAAATRSWSPELVERDGTALAIVTGPGAAPVGLLARRTDDSWHPAILRLAARLFAHEHGRVSGVEPVPRSASDLAFPVGMAIGRAASMQRLYAEVRAVVDGTMPLVLLGETGTGKGVVARLLHDSSPRRHLPLVEVDCGAPLESLMEALAQLRKRTGRGGRNAVPGTLVLDEIGRLEPRVQGALLAALNELTRIEPAGVPRLIATTNLGPSAALPHAGLRSDLWYRLAGAVITVPPLRERVEDLPLLFDHFLLAAAGPHRPAVAPEALRLLLAHDWPGNLRELQWEAQRAAALAAGHGEIAADQLSAAVGTRDQPLKDHPDLCLAEHLERVERRLLLEALEMSRGNLSQAARLLGVTRPRIRRRMASLGVNLPGGADEGGGAPVTDARARPALPSMPAQVLARARPPALSGSL